MAKFKKAAGNFGRGALSVMNGTKGTLIEGGLGFAVYQVDKYLGAKAAEAAQKSPDSMLASLNKHPFAVPIGMLVAGFIAKKKIKNKYGQAAGHALCFAAGYRGAMARDIQNANKPAASPALGAASPPAALPPSPGTGDIDVGALLNSADITGALVQASEVGNDNDDEISEAMGF